MTETELAERKTVESVRKNEKIVVLMKEEVDQEKVCRILSEKYGFANKKDLKDSIYGDNVLLFSIR